MVIGRGSLTRLTLNYRLITDEGTTASVVTYLLPVVAVILGAAVLGDHITAQIIGGMLIVLIGVAITRRQRQIESPVEDLEPDGHA